MLHWSMAAPGFDRPLGVELWLSFIYASYNAAPGLWLSCAALCGLIATVPVYRDPRRRMLHWA